MGKKNHDGGPTFVPRTAIDIRHISSAQLESLGIEEIAFVKPVMTESGQTFAIHAADDTQTAIASSSSLTEAAIIQNEMLPRLVH